MLESSKDVLNKLRIRTDIAVLTGIIALFFIYNIMNDQEVILVSSFLILIIFFIYVLKFIKLKLLYLIIFMSGFVVALLPLFFQWIELADYYLFIKYPLAISLSLIALLVNILAKSSSRTRFFITLIFMISSIVVISMGGWSDTGEMVQGVLYITFYAPYISVGLVVVSGLILRGILKKVDKYLNKNN